MNRAALYLIGGILAIVIVAISALFTASDGSGGHPAGLDQAMQGYMNTILTGDKSNFLTFFSQDSNWRFISYRAGTHATVRNVSFTYADTAKEMEREGGLWTAFFDGTDRYRYKDRIADHPLSHWTLDGTTYSIPRNEGVISFIRWSHDDGRWVIKIIGDDSP